MFLFLTCFHTICNNSVKSTINLKINIQKKRRVHNLQNIIYMKTDNIYMY